MKIDQHRKHEMGDKLQVTTIIIMDASTFTPNKDIIVIVHTVNPEASKDNHQNKLVDLVNRIELKLDHLPPTLSPSRPPSLLTEVSSSKHPMKERKMLLIWRFLESSMQAAAPVIKGSVQSEHSWQYHSCPVTGEPKQLSLICWMLGFQKWAINLKFNNNAEISTNHNNLAVLGEWNALL